MAVIFLVPFSKSNIVNNPLSFAVLINLPVPCLNFIIISETITFSILPNNLLFLFITGSGTGNGSLTIIIDVSFYFNIYIYLAYN